MCEGQQKGWDKEDAVVVFGEMNKNMGCCLMICARPESGQLPVEPELHLVRNAGRTASDSSTLQTPQNKKAFSLYFILFFSSARDEKLLDTLLEANSWSTQEVPAVFVLSPLPRLPPASLLAEGTRWLPFSGMCKMVADFFFKFIEFHFYSLKVSAQGGSLRWWPRQRWSLPHTLKIFVYIGRPKKQKCWYAI